MDNKPLVIPATDDPDTAGFWAATRAEKLVVQRCDDCGKMRFPPRPACTCGSFALQWHEVSGRGRVWSYAVAHAPTLPAFSDLLPYVFAVIELEDAPHLRMVGNLATSADAPINSVSQDEVAIGQDVTVAFRRVTDEVTLPVWIPTNRPELAQ
jgi:uncharacterized OB-fold protein